MHCTITGFHFFTSVDYWTTYKYDKKLQYDMVRITSEI